MKKTKLNIIRASYQCWKQFDAQYYQHQLEGEGKSNSVSLGKWALFRDYFRTGWKEGRDPAPGFSTNGYLEANPDIRDAGINPFLHYLASGKEEGRQSVTLTALDLHTDTENIRLEHELALVRSTFDTEFYLANNPDIAALEDVDSAEHYYTSGWKEGRDPAPDFSTNYYLESNPDIRDAGINPYWHYLVTGKEEGLLACTPTALDLHTYAENIRLKNELALVRSTFDTEFYLANNPDIATLEDVDSAKHYCTSGWKVGLDPTPVFSTNYYLESNPDIRDAGINPYWHYLVTGKKEGRLALRPGGHLAEALLYTTTLEDMVTVWRSKPPVKDMLTVNNLCAKILDAARDKPKGLMVSVSHDNYRDNFGGVQYCIQREENTAAERDMLYLNLSPYQPLPRLAHENEEPDSPVTILLGGQVLGVAPMSALTETMQNLSSTLPEIKMVIHHLLGHSPEQIVKMVRATGSDRCWLWLHDFFTLCPSSALQRNNILFCGGPLPTSNACSLCLFGAERRTHLARITALFEELSVHVIAPSQFTANFWSERSNLAYASLTVNEHMVVKKTKRHKKKPQTKRPITVAFAGFPAAHKGWQAFQRLVHNEQNKQLPTPVRFVYLGLSDISMSGVESIDVRVTAEKPDAMIRAIAEHDVDIVLHWANCAETFSFSTHEAIAAGAYVLTNPRSGNVAAVVKQFDHGAVIADQSDLDAFFSDGRIEKLVAKARAKRSRFNTKLSYSDMTFTVLDQECQA